MIHCGPYTVIVGPVTDTKLWATGAIIQHSEELYDSEEKRNRNSLMKDTWSTSGFILIPVGKPLLFGQCSWLAVAHPIHVLQLHFLCLREIAH